jgi:hypothetical protein
LSREATDVIRFRPEVARLESFRYQGFIAGKSEAVTDERLSAAYSSVVEAFGRLRNLITE